MFKTPTLKLIKISAKSTPSRHISCIHCWALAGIGPCKRYFDWGCPGGRGEGDELLLASPHYAQRLTRVVLGHCAKYIEAVNGLLINESLQLSLLGTRLCACEGLYLRAKVQGDAIGFTI
jgi:hypothetical protein